MEIQLQELINRIKKNGVEAAEGEAESILKAANEQAEKIISDAKAEAESILSSAKAENERMVQSSEDAIRQAGRNLLISFRESVGKEVNAVINDKVNEVYSSDALYELIIKIVEEWTKNADAEDISVLLNSSDLEKLQGALLSGMKEKMLGGVTLKDNDNFSKGFRIAVNNGAAYYDYSAEAVTEMLSAYLNPKVAKLLKEAEEI